jgi:crotonobetainyl-CoA:carnitine CoA-transferase CaiB-like acyl-CoA transferase
MTIAGNDERNLTGSFAGLRVLDFSTTIAGPHCTRMLADMGAEVIKIETEEGETMRTRPPVRNSCSTAFGQLNVGKNSLVLDLKSPSGLEAVRRLVATADVLVENFRPGVMRRLKLDYASLHESNPKLIYCSISGYGQTGPSAELPAYAPVIHAASGYEMAHLAYQPGRSRPDYCGIYHADVLTGVYGFGAISAALYQRAATGQGQHIDVSMLESMLSLTLNELQWSQFEEADTAADVRSDRDHGRLCDGRDRQRENLSEPDEGDRSSRLGERSALCEIFRPPRKLGEPDGRRGGMVACGHDRAMPRRAQ